MVSRNHLIEVCSILILGQPPWHSLTWEDIKLSGAGKQFYCPTPFSRKRPTPLKLSLQRGTGAKIEDSRNLYRILSPINYVKEGKSKIPPVFLASGKQDRIVDAYQSEELSDELHKNAINNVYLELPWANHAFDVVINGPGGQLVFQYMTQFLVWIISKRIINEIEHLANEHNIIDVYSKEKLKLLKSIKEGKPKEEIEQMLFNIAESTDKYQTGKKIVEK